MPQTALKPKYEVLDVTAASSNKLLRDAMKLDPQLIGLDGSALRSARTPVRFAFYIKTRVNGKQHRLQCLVTVTYSGDQEDILWVTTVNFPDSIKAEEGAWMKDCYDALHARLVVLVSLALGGTAVSKQVTQATLEKLRELPNDDHSGRSGEA